MTSLFAWKYRDVSSAHECVVNRHNHHILIMLRAKNIWNLCLKFCGIDVPCTHKMVLRCSQSTIGRQHVYLLEVSQ